ncbi:MAG TPA: molybdate ABC transporter substrate-binding protein [Thermomicrobiales bacterium]|nr:molybdate ABC transporter substrate-binding protein [Thermomicrobiales bacterium]
MRGSRLWLTRRRFRYFWLSLSCLAFFAVAWIPLTTLPVVAQPTLWECPSPATQSEQSEPTPLRVSTPVAEFPVEGGDLTVFAAASLTDAFEAIESDLESANPDLSITYNFGGSPALVTQLKEGAEADVFASANVAQMDAALEAGLITGDATTFVRNRLVIVTPADNPAVIESAADLGEEGTLLVLAQAAVPVGQYAREAVCLMAIDAATYGSDFVQRVAANVVSEEEDVRDVLAKVALGEADAGIVYVSDAAAAGEQVHVVDIPDEVNVIATYPIAVLAEGDQALGSAFIAYLLRDEGHVLLERFGFQPVA